MKESDISQMKVSGLYGPPCPVFDDIVKDMLVYQEVNDSKLVELRVTGDDSLLLLAAWSGAEIHRLSSNNVEEASLNGFTPLMLAALEGHAETCSQLLQMGADADVSLTNGCTALMLAARSNHVAVIQVG